jgi:glycosyltransferase involved in cell wall biosynthesis
MHIGLNAHLLSGRAGYRSAGIHSYIHNLLTNLPAAAPADWRFTAMVGGANHADYAGMMMQRARFDTESPPRRILWEQIMQPGQLGQFDLYHALAFIAPLWLRVPTVVTVYDLSFIHYPERLPASRRLYLRLLTGLTCQRARRVIAISHSTARDLAATYGLPAEKIDVAACGYDATRYHPLPAAEIAAFRHGKHLPERFWLFIGTLEPRKNLVTLLEAYAQLPASARLPLIIGGGKGWQYESIFEAVERLKLIDSVRFEGFIPDEDLALWYNSAEIFIYPSVFEGFGLPVLDAMACGTPVVVSAATSLPEVVGSAGLCVPPHRVTAWRETLRRVYDDREWRSAARDQGFVEAARYNWRITAEQTVKSYRYAVTTKTSDSNA